jgi:hypothetical protein
VPLTAATGLPTSRKKNPILAVLTRFMTDYVKAIFDSVGVSSRGELVAKLFAEHYAPIHLDPDSVVHAAGE